MTLDTWHLGYGVYYDNISEPYILGMVKKLHVRGTSIDNRQSSSIAWGKTGHKSVVRGPKRTSGGF